MRAEVCWIEGNYPGRIALIPRTRGGEWLEDEAASWSAAGLDTIVLLLESEEIAAFDLTREAELCQANRISFFSFPVTDRSVPASKTALIELLNKIKPLLAEGKNIGIHCRQSIGRASILAASLMTLFGIEPDDAFRKISKARGLEFPETDEQRDWARNFAEELTLVSR